MILQRSADECLTSFNIDLNVAVPDEYTFDQKYWRIYPWDRPWVYLIDQNRWDDAIVYYIHFLSGQVALSELPFWNSPAVPDSFPPPDVILPRLCREGRIQLVKGTRSTHVLGPNAGIDAILRDVARFDDRPNPAYGFHGTDASYTGDPIGTETFGVKLVG